MRESVALAPSAAARITNSRRLIRPRRSSSKTPARPLSISTILPLDRAPIGDIPEHRLPTTGSDILHCDPVAQGIEGFGSGVHWDDHEIANEQIVHLDEELGRALEIFRRGRFL